MRTLRQFIGGSWLEGRAEEHSVYSSRTGGEYARFALSSVDDVERAVAAAREALDGAWAGWAPARRADALRALADDLDRRVEDISQTAAEEIGTPIVPGRPAQALAPAFSLRYYADQAERFAFTERRESDTGSSFVVREPVGVLAALIPWNMPLALAAQKAGAALAAGCTVVVKASPDAPLIASALAEAAEHVGLPPGVLNFVTAGPEASQHLVAHPAVDKVSFTGSTGVGRQIGALCGGLVKRLTLELGGKSAAIILADASFEEISPLVAASIVGGNSGQGCACQTRILVPRARGEEAADALSAAFRALTFGDPLDPEVRIGPMVSEHHQERVQGYIDLGRAEGADALVGGATPVNGDPGGFYVSPTLFGGVRNDMRIAREEIFGPVGVVIEHDGIEDAVSIANDSEFGLAGTVWTADADVGFEVARRIRSGTFSVNSFWVDRNAPFGGMKQSGVGREMGVEGLAECLELKSISMPPGSTLPESTPLASTSRSG